MGPDNIYQLILISLTTLGTIGHNSSHFVMYYLFFLLCSIVSIVVKKKHLSCYEPLIS